MHVGHAQPRPASPARPARLVRLAAKQPPRRPQDFVGFSPGIWGDCQQLQFARDLLQCALYDAQGDCDADDACAWGSDVQECSLTADALYNILAGGDDFGEQYRGGMRACSARSSRAACLSERFSLARKRVDAGRLYMLSAVSPSGNVTTVFNGTSA
jgi:hypothetical protein